MKTDLYLHKRNIQHCFDRAAITYDAYADLQHQIGLELLSSLSFMKKSCKYIADVGAGTGLLTQKLLKSFPFSNLFSIDLSSQMLLICKERLKNTNHQLVCSDFDSLPFLNHQFDLIYSNMTLQWSVDFRQTLIELLRCIKKEGILAFSLFVDDTLGDLKCFFKINSFISTREIIRILSGLRISVIEFNVQSYHKKFKSLMEAIHFFKKTGANYVFEKEKPGGISSHLRRTYLMPFDPIKKANFKVASCIIRKIE